MSLSLRSPTRINFCHPVSPIKKRLYTLNKPKIPSNNLFSRAQIPHANSSPSRKNPDENQSISPRADFDENFDLEKQEAAISSAHICHDSDADTEDVSFHWEDQDSFLNDLQESSFKGKDDSHHLDALVDSIQTTFTAKAESLNVKFAQLMVPVSNQIKSTFRHIEADADTDLFKGLDTYEHAVRSFVRVSCDEKQEIDNKCLATQEKIASLLEDLEEEYQVRDKIWLHYEQALEEQVNAMKELLQDAPARMEKTITKLEKKQAKELEGSQPDAMNMNRLLAQLLGNR
ncbi:hypothetical protein CVT24_011450 [Panaeolus cyanescens]|uniref:Uncharacterized protein n=1 Tax=Panaeolus cyanescens TaxID=181874 RepID=A0A409VGD5_9AGAR|nr:hypothetical protein CVT24_011450 [Panaeolus cyanescens]